MPPMPALPQDLPLYSNNYLSVPKHFYISAVSHIICLLESCMPEPTLTYYPQLFTLKGASDRDCRGQEGCARQDWLSS